MCTLEDQLSAAKLDGSDESPGEYE